MNNEYNDLNSVLIQMNKEYKELLDSKEYNLGRRIYKYSHWISHLNIKSIVNRYKTAAISKKVRKLHMIEAEPTFFSQGEYLETQYKGVVYTSIVDGYDELQNPLIQNRNIDYICLCENIQSKSAIWEIVDPHRLCEIPSIYKGTELNRFCKLHPFKLFSNYDYSIYIDGNVKVIGDISVLFSLAKKSKVGIAMHMHRFRNDAYEEAKALMLYKKGNPEGLKRSIEKYRKEGFPELFGLCECGIIVVDHANPIAQKIYETWWADFLESGSGRDQLSFAYAVWKNEYNMNDIGCLGNNIKENLLFRFQLHNRNN